MEVYHDFLPKPQQAIYALVDVNTQLNFTTRFGNTGYAFKLKDEACSI